MVKSILVFLAVVGLAVAVNVTVSGVSSGGAFAVQYHVANSANVSGAGIVAGIPYFCAQGMLGIAETSCMQYPSLISVPELVTATKLAFSLGSIDSPTNMAKSKVYLYSGTLDTVVVPGVAQKLLQYYKTFVPAANIFTQFNISSDHAMITNSYGNECAYLGDPYINNCNYDAAGIILNFLYGGSLQAPITPVNDNIISLPQAPFIPTSSYMSSLGPNAYLYVPTGCPKGAGCEAHVVFHGCEQTTDDINTTFVTSTGYNGWAEANNIVIIYPQVVASPLNPAGCWDWWGYTGFSYATKNAVQIATVKNIVSYVLSTY